MPAYNTNNQIEYNDVQVPGTPLTPASPPNLDQNVPAYAFENETPSAGETSQQFYLPPNHTGAAKPVSVVIQFAANPGTFEIDIQTADIDDPPTGNNYVTEQAITTGLNAAYTTRAELDVRARWVRAVAVSSQNAVAVSVWFVRQY